MMKKFNRLTKVLLCGFVLLFSINIIPLTYANASTEPTLNAEGAILIDATTNQILYSKNGDKQFSPASTTKVMTAIIVLEKCKLEDKITIGKNSVLAEGSSIGLREGEVYTVEDLLQGLLLMSGNDCATALAEHVSGSIEEFSKLMNEKAKSLGATNTNFKNPSGLPDPEHLTTPYDLALIMSEALNYPDFIRISRINSTKLPPSTIDGNQLWLSNHNYLINNNSKYFYPYALSGKNGYTIEARHTFAISAEKDGHKLVATFLKAEDKNQNYLDMANLFEYGFNNFTQEKIYSKDEVIDTIEVENGIKIPLIASKDIFYTYKNDESEPTKKLEYETPNLSRKNITKGEEVSKANVVVNGEVYSSLELISNESREFTSSLKFKYFFLDNKILIGFGILVILALVLFLLRSFNLRRRKKKLQNKHNRIINRKKYNP
ncbi:MAG: serine hydrolase [Clostridium sp.]